MRRLAFALLPLCLCGALHAADATDAARKLAQDAVIVDTHIDAPELGVDDWRDLSVLTPDREFDYPRAREGGLDVAWMSIFTSHDADESGKAWTQANNQIDLVTALAAQHPDKFAILRSPKDVDKLREGGRVLLPMGMENGAPIGDDLKKVEFFFNRGIRYITLAHGGNNRISDSSYQRKGKWGGLSPFGEQVVKEMNRLGIIVDVSHLSDEAVRDVLKLTDVPVIASHSGMRHFTPGFNRNMDDALAKEVAAHGGVVQISFGTVFLDAEAAKAFDTRRWTMEDMKAAGKSDAELKAFADQWKKDHPAPVLHTDSVIDQIDHAVKLVGVDHVGIGSDFDGVSGELPVELKSVADFPNLVAGLQARGYKDEDIRKILGGNMLRVWNQIEDRAEKR
jgi:membrane dipeptidase